MTKLMKSSSNRPSLPAQVVGFVMALLLFVMMAHGAYQPMRLSGGTHTLRPSADGIARVPATCTRQDLPAPDSTVPLKVHPETVKIVRVQNGTPGQPVGIDKAVDQGWIDWPSGVGEPGRGSPSFVGIKVLDRAEGVEFQLVVEKDQPSLLADEQAVYAQTLPIVKRYARSHARIDEKKNAVGFHEVNLAELEKELEKLPTDEAREAYRKTIDDRLLEIQTAQHEEWDSFVVEKLASQNEAVAASALGKTITKIEIGPGPTALKNGKLNVLGQWDPFAKKWTARTETLFEVDQILDVLNRVPELAVVAGQLPEISYPLLRQRELIKNRVTVGMEVVNGQPVLKHEVCKEPLNLAAFNVFEPEKVEVPKEWQDLLGRGHVVVDVTGVQADETFMASILPQAMGNLEKAVTKRNPEFEWTLAEDNQSQARFDRRWREPRSLLNMTVDGSSIGKGDELNRLLSKLLGQQAGQAMQGNVRVLYADAADKVAEKTVVDKWIDEVDEHGSLDGKLVKDDRFILGLCLHDPSAIRRLTKALLEKGAEEVVPPTRELYGPTLCLANEVLLKNSSKLGVLARRSMINAEKEVLRRLEVLSNDPSQINARALFPMGGYRILLNAKGEINLDLIKMILRDLRDSKTPHGASSDAGRVNPPVEEKA